MCSTKEPKIRSSTSATVNAGSITIRAGLSATVTSASLLDTSVPPATAGGTSSRALGSALQARVRDALDDLALEQQERDDQRQRAHDRQRHDLGVLRAVEAVHRREADGDGLQVLRRRDDEGPDEVVPRQDEREDPHRGGGRPRERHPDPPVDRPRTGPVHARALLELRRDAVEEALVDQDR